MIKVSVIIPVYNAEKYLEECLNSLCSQTEQNIEIICVDDGSADGSVEILNRFVKEDSRIRIIKGNHAGGGAARNTGLKEAKGEYVAFVDADDFVDADYIEKLYVRSVETNADITICSVRFLYQATGAVREVDAGLRMENLPSKEVFSYKDMKKYIFNTFHNWVWNKLFKRTFLEKHNIEFQEILRTNDLLFTCKSLMEAERISTISQSLITYRIDEEGNNCQNTNEVQLYGFYEAFKALKDYLVGKNVYEDVKQSFVNHALDGCIANLNVAEFSENHKVLFERLNSQIFDELDILGHNKEYFYKFNVDNKTYERFEKVQQRDYTQYILYRAADLQRDFSKLQHDVYYTDCRVIEQENTINCKNDVIKGKDDMIQKHREEIVHLNIALHEISSLMQFYQDGYNAAFGSFSYRFGHKVTAIPRWIVRKLRGR